MQNGNLDTWLHPRPTADLKHLDLIQRVNIAVSIADALAYLHHDCGNPIVHCDLKPTNILLDDDMNAHLGDFGIASLVLDSRSAPVGHSGLNRYADCHVLHFYLAFSCFRKDEAIFYANEYLDFRLH